MNTYETILNRRSIRAYLDKPVAAEDLKEILEAGTWAPSGVNLQPWYLVAIQSKEKLALLGDVMERVSAKIEPSLKARFANAPAVVDETTQFIKKLGGAPVYILAFQLKPDYDNKADMINLSIGAALENILLAAREKGLGTCWLTAPVEAEVGNELRDLFAPGKGPLVALITLGYPAKEARAPKRKDGRYTIV
ncbi:nitroreductase family protein [Frisingicoccus sp.]|uniref:nitroreductase family protein n=1 Tax=Frisingicoccus sp. TaxID=1918627 RepID=UPI003AB88BB8